MKIKTKDIILIALFAALTAVGALIKIPIGPAPITLQNFITILSGILLGPYLGSLSQLIYVLLGLAGIPIFSSGGGFSYILSPDFGYLIGFIAASFAIGKLVENKASYVRIITACIAGVFVIYIIGTPYLYMILKYVSHANITFAYALKAGFLVFLPGDILKAAIASYLGKRLIPIIKNFR